MIFEMNFWHVHESKKQKLFQAFFLASYTFLSLPQITWKSCKITYLKFFLEIQNRFPVRFASHGVASHEVLLYQSCWSIRAGWSTYITQLHIITEVITSDQGEEIYPKFCPLLILFEI